MRRHMSSIFKYGLIFLVLIFGVFMFAAGALLPKDFYARIVTGNKKDLPVADGKTASATGNSTEHAGDTTKKNDQQDTPYYYPNLLLSAYEMESSPVYSLQIGLYLNESNAKQMQTQLSGYEITSHYVLVEDEQKRLWYLLSFGKYQNIDAAQTAAYEFLNTYGYKTQIIQFPSQQR